MMRGLLRAVNEKRERDHTPPPRDTEASQFALRAILNIPIYLHVTCFCLVTERTGQ